MTINFILYICFCIGLYDKTYVRLQHIDTEGYLGCPNSVCDLRTCSLKNFESCTKELFQIIGEGGGNIKSGQRVRFRYAAAGNSWLGCPHYNRCDKRPCAGTVSRANNFNICWGEIFVIYGRGRRNGENILHGDVVSIYYLPQRSGSTYSRSGYITIAGSFLGADTSISSCLGSTPPSYFRYSSCLDSVFRIYIKTI